MSHPVLARLASPDPEARVAACRDAVDDPSAVLLLDGLAGALADPVPAVARAAQDALVTLGERVDLNAVLREALTADEPALRWGAAFVSARLAPPGLRLVPPLVDGLGAHDGHVRWAAARLLVETGRLVGEVMPLLCGLARDDPRPVVRRMATHCLRQLAPESPDAARVLVEATRDEDLQVRRAALAALSAAVDPPPEVVARLCDALAGDDDPPSRRIASVALGQIGAAAGLPEAALAALRRARRDPDPDLQRGADRALSRMGRA